MDIVFSKKSGDPDRMNRSLIHDPDADKPCVMKCRKPVLESPNLWMVGKRKSRSLTFGTALRQATGVTQLVGSLSVTRCSGSGYTQIAKISSITTRRPG
jgi:hypothetical protein